MIKFKKLYLLVFSMLLIVFFSKATPSIASDLNRSTDLDNSVYAVNSPPSTSDGVQTPSRDAFWFLVPWRNGFTLQPQPEQYIKVGTAANLNIQTTGGLPVLPTSATVTLQQWTLQSNGSFTKATPVNYTSSTSLVALHSTTINRTNLPIGTYYYQMSVRYGSVTYYSQLAKVEVVDKDYPATAIEITPNSPVVFANADYSVTANLTPTNSTSPVTWASNNVTYLPTSGRTVKFKTSEIAGVNDSLENPGLPLTLTGNSNGLSSNKTVYVGGLKAQSLTEGTAKSQGISWTVEGLTPLVNQYGNDNTWSYKWSYYDDKGTSFDFTSAEALNASGTITNIGDINTVKKLNIPSTSLFIDKAINATKNNKPFSLKLVLTTTNNGNELRIPTNQASLKVISEEGKLLLKQVPSFDFGKIPINKIYNGNLNDIKKIQDTKQLEISDNRSGNKTWKLSAKMSNIQNSNQALKNISLDLSGFPNTGIKTLTDKSDITLLTSSAQSNTGLWNILANLKISPNPNAKLQNNDVYSGTITWQLTSDEPTVLKLK